MRISFSKNQIQGDSTMPDSPLTNPSKSADYPELDWILWPDDYDLQWMCNN